MRKLLLVSLLLLAVLAGTATHAWLRYQEFLTTPLNIPVEGMVFEVPAGATGSAITDMLAEQGLTEKGWPWRLLMRLQPRVYHPGEFELEHGLGPEALLDLLASGKVRAYRFTVVEGWNLRQLLQQLAQADVLLQTLPQNYDEAADMLREALQLEHAEGWFLPETYQFTRGDSDVDLLARANQAMQEALDDAWQTRQIGLPMESPYELLTLASIIEKETALDEERGEIAGVFVRRLRKGMRLQTDPTVIYGLGESFDGDIRRRDLRTDTPYNTYTRHGLPPTPIAMPGRASLLAAADPAAGDTLYFVADGKGGHTFSVTLEEHNAAVRRYLEDKG